MFLVSRQEGYIFGGSWLATPLSVNKMGQIYQELRSTWSVSKVSRITATAASFSPLRIWDSCSVEYRQFLYWVLPSYSGTFDTGDVSLALAFVATGDIGDHCTIACMLVTVIKRDNIRKQITTTRHIKLQNSSLTFHPTGFCTDITKSPMTTKQKSDLLKLSPASKSEE